MSARDGDAKRRERIEKARAIWAGCIDALGDHAFNHPAARRYFEARGIDLAGLPPFIPGAPAGILPPTIAYCPSIKCVIFDEKSGQTRHLQPGPAIVFQVQNAAGDVTGVQRIYLERDGSPRKRSDMPNPKLALGEIMGGAIRLGTPSAATAEGTLLLAEGPETAMAVMAATGLPAWSTISAGGLAGLELPPHLVDEQVGHIAHVIVMADLDQGGLWRDERTRARRWVRPGWEAALKAIARWSIVHPHLVARVAMPDHLTAPGLVLEGPSSVDVFGDPAPMADGAPRKGVDWLDVGAMDATLVARAVGRARTLDELDDAQVLAAPGARAILERGEDGLKDEEVPKQKAAVMVPPGLELPKHSADRARLMLERFFSPGCELDDPAERKKARVREQDPQRWTICYWVQSGVWMIYTGMRWVGIKDAEVTGVVLDRLRGFVQMNADGPAPANLTVRAADDIRKAMEGYAGVRTTRLPVWTSPTFTANGEPVWGVTLDRLVASEGSGGEGGEVGGEETLGYVSCLDGLLDLAALLQNRVRVIEHSPRYLSTALLPHRLPLEEIERELADDPKGERLGGGLAATMWPVWGKFLAEVFEDDGDCIRALQQWFGYCLIEDTALQAIMLMPGPPGSGKSTIFDQLSLTIGRDAVASTDLMQLAEKNETYALLGRRVAQMTDAHTDQRTAHRTTEMLKRISGGDAVGVEGKFKDRDPSVQLNIKFMIACNTVPKLPDASGALCRRLVVVPTMRSFAKKPDRDLRRKLAAEARGVLVWALFGLRDLKMSGRFHQPECGARIIEQFRRLSSPMAAFLEDCCIVSAESAVAEEVLFWLYREYLEHNGNAKPSKEQFFAQLQANVPGMVRVPSSVGLGMMIRGVRPLHVSDPERQELDGLVEIGKAPVRTMLDKRSIYEFEWLPDEQQRRQHSGQNPANRYGSDPDPAEWGVRAPPMKPDLPYEPPGTYGV